MEKEMLDIEIQTATEAPAIFKEAIRPVTLKFEDVVYKIKQNNSTNNEERVILNGVSGLVQPGEILAMLGPSGSGKTTLITALGGRLGGRLSGAITYNKKSFSNAMKRNTGFVTQDDFLYPHLTVTETLFYTALLRLPNTLSKAKKAMQAEAVIIQLELTKCKNSVVGGNCLYFGKVSEVMDYLSGIGYIPLVAMNPADFILDLANGLAPDGSHENKSKVKQSLTLAYKHNRLYNLKAQLQGEQLQETNSSHFQDGSEDKNFAKWPTTWWQQFSVLLRRGLKERRHESFSGSQINQVVAVALLAGLLWWQSNISHLQDRTGLLFFMSEFWGFFPLLQAIFTFPQERKMLEKERSSGTYMLSSYFISRIVADLPMELALPTLFVTITYWMAGLKPTAGHFFHTLLVLLLSVLVAQGMGLALGALIMDQKRAAVLASVLMVSFQLAGGFFVQYVPAFIAWIKYISIINYSYKLLLGSQYNENDTYLCDSGVCLVRDFPSIKHVGLSGQIGAAVALAIMLVGWRLIAYLALMRTGL
ncbi:hypothetical protein L3X38_041149 [Prunus dulcis]|uniref:ABC transporter domain-containing protein n=1 Tax=Prunus dulcis TaxID=3755 RepID=A0AAD4YK01_PRUDU|nr:hypothetical protein L3X38_041149 [Prunus dulcis]